MLPASAERLPVGLLEALRALRADSGAGAAIGIDQSKNLGLTAAIAGRSLPTNSGDQFGVSWRLPAGRAAKSCATLGGLFQEGLGPRPRRSNERKKKQKRSAGICVFDAENHAVLRGVARFGKFHGACNSHKLRGEKMKQLLVAVLLVLLFVMSANAQTFRGAINGTVTDPSGAAVPGATVKATEIGTNIDHTTVTSAEGQFAFQDMPLGLYKVTASATGWMIKLIKLMSFLIMK